MFSAELQWANGLRNSLEEELRKQERSLDEAFILGVLAYQADSQFWSEMLEFWFAPLA